MKIITIIFLALTLCISFSSISFSKDVRGSHSNLQCLDCHGTATPEKQAPQSACRNCHGDMTDSKVLTFSDSHGKSYTVSPHNSHAGSLRCTLCHTAHKTPTLYCNEACHHTFSLQMP
ncbi:cytochrome c3 family protein [Seleniivibrio sp.]|uniref:cytochrome c3 family protein n=1 Tax=Seleniivibrio sp. TaxID=2898801 RepID=UPI003414F1EB